MNLFSNVLRHFVFLMQNTTSIIEYTWYSWDYIPWWNPWTSFKLGVQILKHDCYNNNAIVSKQLMYVFFILVVSLEAHLASDKNAYGTERDRKRMLYGWDFGNDCSYNVILVENWRVFMGKSSFIIFKVNGDLFFKVHVQSLEQQSKPHRFGLSSKSSKNGNDNMFNWIGDDKQPLDLLWSNAKILPKFAITSFNI